MGQPFDNLPVNIRAERYREMADAALLKAKRIKTASLRAEYLTLATAWHSMAQELEKAPDGRTQLEESQARIKRRARKDKHQGARGDDVS